jgi:signal transduction histidine kinase/ligand-binding sensor domain-containing protein
VGSAEEETNIVYPLSLVIIPRIPTLLFIARSRHVFFLTALLVGACLPLQAERLPVKTYTPADGLAHNEVRRIVRDSRGFLWFCTADGLSRFDGYAFTTFGVDQGLPTSYINDFLETATGEFWVATSGGLARFDPKGRAQSRVVFAAEARTPGPMFVVVSRDAPGSSLSATALSESRDGTVWVGASDGLYRLERANGRPSLQRIELHMPAEFPSQRIVTDLQEDARGSLWIAATDALYRRWPDGTTARYTSRDGLPDDYLTDLLQDREGRLWAGTRTRGFFQFSADDTPRAPIVLQSLTPSSGFPASFVFRLFETSDKRFLIATDNGLVEFFPDADQRGSRFRRYSDKDGLSDSEITAISQDLAGNLWLGTIDAGAMKVTRDGFGTYGPQDGVGAVNAIFEDRAGRLCFRSNRLGCFESGRIAWVTLAAVPGLGWVQEGTLQARTGDWWVGTDRGVYRFPSADRLAQLQDARPLSWYTTRDGLADLQVFRLFEDSHGGVWISTIPHGGLGLARWDPLTQRVRDVTHAPELSGMGRAHAFGEDTSGNVWIGFNGGLARYAQNTFTLFGARDGVPGEILNIHTDRAGRVWLASGQRGLLRVDDPGAARPHFVSYTTAQGLSSNRTAVIAEDAGGHIYVGGSRGLDRIDPATGRVKHFTTADGLPSGVFLTAFSDRRGVLWFGMTGGVARLAPAADVRAASPKILIDGLRVRGEPQLVSALGEQHMSLPDLAPDRSQLQIDFVALAFGSGEVLRYQYRLEGADGEWSPLSEQRTVTYASLSPGRYTFDVRAVNSDGVVSDHPASIAFTILRPLWLRWWFLALAALAVGLAVYSAHRYRLKRLLDMANMRTRIAADLHDDIGANLTRIALLSEVANRTHAATQGGQVDGPLSSIANIARESVGSMSDIVWAINPKRETLLDLTRRMRQHADEIFRLRGIGLRFEARGEKDDLRLGIDVRRDLLLIFKEVVNNAARHSGCSRVDIGFHVEGARLVLVVVDNGRGFDASQESEGEGLVSMTRRAHKLNGSLEITSRVGAGTTVTVSVPASS